MATTSNDTPLDEYFLKGSGPLEGVSVELVPVTNDDVFINHRGLDVKKGLVRHLSAALRKLNFCCFVDKEEIRVGDLAKAMPTTSNFGESSGEPLEVVSVEEVKEGLVRRLSAAFRKLNFCCCVDYKEIQVGDLANPRETPSNSCESSGPLEGASVEEVPVTNYDVFINHRGPDVKKGLVSHLSAAFRKLNFSCFVDYEEIQVGDLAKTIIKSAIQHSKIHISIFSPGYAESSWCLDELLFIMECSRRSTHLFLPVFFNVTPSDLRLRMPLRRESCYSSAFEGLSTSYETNVINNWKRALSEASDFKGYIFPGDFQGFEAMLVESTISKVIEVLSRSTLLYGPEYPVGLDKKLQEALDLMKRGKQLGEVQKLGIYGMGGLGKTTLAKSIYNRIHREFESACFLQNVSESSKDGSKGLTGLQKEILQELLKTNEISVPNTARGKQMMQDKLEGKKVLIILDDVSEKEQLDQLMPAHDCRLGEGSQIVITTRDSQVLIWAKAETHLLMEGLSRDLARDLFNWHAFPFAGEPSKDPEQLQREASGEFKKLAEKVAEACHGLPLALEVLGADLQGKDISEWEATVNVLEEDRMVDPHRKVMAILKITFDALRSAGEREMFLDIACFLFQQPKDKALRIWRSVYGGNAELYLKHLIRKCLVRVDQNGDLTMHDLLRNMGREIADNSHQDYWEGSHLWREEEVHRILTKRKGTSHVGGLSSNAQKEWDTTSFTGMDELKLLVLNKVTLTGEFNKIPQLELRWFQLRSCQREDPAFLGLDNVVVLDLEGSKLTSLRCGDYMLQNLKELNLNNCSNCTELLIDFSKSAKSLEILILRSCVKLMQLPDSIGELSSSLRYLDTSGCCQLKALPKGITNLRGLTTLHMNDCGGLTELPDAIGQLAALEKIGVDGIPLVTLPRSFGSLSGLVSLSLDHSFQLRELPPTICRLTRLTSLDMISCPLISEIPPEVTQLTNLVQLHISDCKSVSQLPAMIGNLGKLVELHVQDMVKLVILPSSIRELWMLKVLNLQGCTSLSGVEGLPPSITSLVVGGCTSLGYLDMSNCMELQTLPDGLESVCHLSRLDISGCMSLVDLPTGRLEKLTSLRTLDLAGSGVSIVQDIRSPWIQKMVSLEEVTMQADGVPEYLENAQEDQCLVKMGDADEQMEMVVPEELDGACRSGAVCCLIVLLSFDRLTSFNLVTAEVRGDKSVKVSHLLFDGPKVYPSVYDEQLQVGIYRASHQLVASLRGGDTIRVRACGSVRRGIVKLMNGRTEMEKTLENLTLTNTTNILEDIRASLKLEEDSRFEPMMEIASVEEKKEKSSKFETESPPLSTRQIRLSQLLRFKATHDTGFHD